MPQDSHIPFYHTTIRRKLQEVFKIFLRKLCGVKFPSKCNSKCCCCGCLDNLRICLLADGSTCPCRPLRGGLPSLPPARPAFSLLSCPHPPAPFPAGRGSPKVYFAGGFAPGTPALNRLRYLQNLPSGCPAHGSLRFGAKPKEPPFHGQCRQPRRGGDRGRWNYPSQATAAFEMVLSPGAGRTSAAGVQPPVGHHSGKVGRRPTGQVPRRVHV